MVSLSMKKPYALTISTSIIFLFGFVSLTHLVPGGELFGAFMVIPLCLIAWGWGARVGFIAALLGTAYTESIFSPEYLLVHHNPISPYWILIVLAPVVFLFLGLVVGRLGDTLRELSSALQAQKAAEDARQVAESRYKDLIDFAPEAISVIQDYKPMLLNRKALDRTGYTENELQSGEPADFLPADELQKSIEFQQRILSGDSDEEKIITRYRVKGGKDRWIEVTGKRINWDSRPAGLYFSVDITERRQAEIALAESHAHLQAVLNALPDLMMELDRDGRLYDLRSTHSDPLLSPLVAPLGRTVRELFPPDAASMIMDAISKTAVEGEYHSPALKVVSEGKTRWLELSVAAVGSIEDPGCHFIALERDVTDRKNLEEQVVQSQKMEAVGRLAGGIAHDFNNILMVILGFCDLIKGRPTDQEEVRKDIGVIKDSAEKAASLTRQLLAFSRKQMIQATPTDLNILLRQSEQLLRRVLGEDIVLAVVTGRAPSMVKVDAGQLQQVIMNLAVNARDAMPGGGRLSIESHNMVLGPESPSMPTEVAPGGYAVITVHDTGEGMDKETLGRIFEPFFTTKDVGKGTGLGLSIVYGIVRQLDGFVTVDSRVGSGTSFCVYLPLTGDAPKDADQSQTKAPPGGTETVLLVEDEESVRRLISRSLRSWGYAVMEARDGAEAMRVCKAHAGPIDLLLTDMVMPGMRGGQVARQVKALFPGVQVVQMTGYTDKPDELAATGEDPRVLHKPFDLADLRTLVRETLDRPAARP